MNRTRIIIDPAYKIAEVDPRVFGGFLEHMGRAIYEGVYDPQSALADEHGFRKDCDGCSPWVANDRYAMSKS